MEFFEVGGCVRDNFLGVTTKDIDFAVVLTSFDEKGTHGPSSDFAQMFNFLRANGFEIFVTNPEFVTVRARFPKGDSRRKGLTADFVLARKDGPSSDGRRPDFVEAGTLEDDLNRRDFRCNAIARAMDGTIIDPHNGVRDIEDRILRAVGDPMTRFREDGLRVLRALRFTITKGFDMDEALEAAVRDPETATLLSGISNERIRDELDKMFKANIAGTFETLENLPEALRLVINESVNIALEVKVRVA